MAKTTARCLPTAFIPTTEVTHGTTDIDLLRASARDCRPFNLTTWIEWRRRLSCSRWACVALPRMFPLLGWRLLASLSRQTRWPINRPLLVLPTIGLVSTSALTVAMPGRFDWNFDDCVGSFVDAIQLQRGRTNCREFHRRELPIRVVLGIEGDWQWSNLTGNSQALAPLATIGESLEARLPSPQRLRTTARSAAGLASRSTASLSSALAAGHRQSLHCLCPYRRGSIRYYQR